MADCLWRGGEERRRAVGPLQGNQRSHWRSWRPCSLEVGSGEGAKVRVMGAPDSHLQSHAHICGVPCNPSDGKQEALKDPIMTDLVRSLVPLRANPALPFEAIPRLAQPLLSHRLKH